ncbi:MAG: hypothetical protein KY475_14010 [Planctomycetes bacterium]|nr:hypothetical protein [Planctomycetota bacterium]
MPSRLLAVVVTVAALSAMLRPAQGEELSLAERQALANVATAYVGGDVVTSVGILSPLLGKWDDGKTAAADALLAESGLPPVARQFAEARLAELKLKPRDRAPRLSARETLLVLPELRKELESALAAAKDHPVMAEPLPQPESLEAYDELFWNAHVLENQLLNAAMIAEYMTQLAARLSRRDAAKLDEARKGIAETDYRAIAERVGAMSRELAERQVELRADRLAMAKEWLGEEQVSQRKFLAAFVWQMDAMLVEEFYRAGQSKKRRDDGPQYLRARLNDPGFFHEVGANAREARLRAGDLTTKSTLLYAGLHWWYRGRYGIGPMIFGLAKHPAAIHTEAGQLGLFMPLAPPKPTDPARLAQGEAPQPLFDRRHHYWWAWEDRRMDRSGSNESVEVSTMTDRITTSTFW